MKAYKRIISGLLMASLLLTACGFGNQGYTSKNEVGKKMQLVNFIGETRLFNEEGEHAPDVNQLPLNLYSGDSLETKKDSHIAVDLDQYKHITLDEDTKASIEETKDGMTITVDQGGVFFVTTKKVEKGKYYKFKNSNTTCATLGTMGVFRTVNETDTVIMIFEGQVKGEAGKNKEAFDVGTGELATIHSNEDGSAEVSKGKIMFSDVDNFVKNEIGQSEEYSQQLIDNGGKELEDYPQLNDLDVQEDIYQSVIDAYSEMIYEGNESPEIEQLEFTSGEGMSNGKEYYFPGYLFDINDRVYLYTLYDINGDGIKELLIEIDNRVIYEDQEEYELFDIWTIKNNQPAHLINLINGECSMRICENNTLLYEFKGGNTTQIVYFEMNMNNSLNYTDIISTDAKPLVCYRHTELENNLPLMDLHNAILEDQNNSNVITEEEYDNIENSYKPMTNILEWNEIEPSLDFREKEAHWKKVYRDWFMSNDGKEVLAKYSRYRSIYLDDDMIAEIIFGDDNWDNVSLAYIDSNDNVRLANLASNAWFYMEDGSGKIITYTSNGGESCWMSILKNQKFEEFIDLGGSDSGMTVFKWRGKTVSYSEYREGWRKELDETKVLEYSNSHDGFSLKEDFLDEFQ